MDKIQINQIQWDDPINAALAKSAGDDLPKIRYQVRKGLAQLWLCESSEYRAHLVTRIDDNELVIVCFEGSGVCQIMPLFINRAKELNLSIRAHVTRKGFFKFAERLNFKLSEYVMRYDHG